MITFDRTMKEERTKWTLIKIYKDLIDQTITYLNPGFSKEELLDSFDDEECILEAENFLTGYDKKL